MFHNLIILVILQCFLVDGYFSQSVVIEQDAIAIEDCKWNEFELKGKVMFVSSFPDIKVKVVDAFPDLKVKYVDAFPDECGEWQVVESFPDIKIQLVESFPDIKIQIVDHFPGLD